VFFEPAGNRVVNKPIEKESDQDKTDYLMQACGMIVLENRYPRKTQLNARDDKKKDQAGIYPVPDSDWKRM
jgi:hypothetical protein